MHARTQLLDQAARPPLIEALDDIKRLIKTFWKFGGPGDEGSSNGAPSLDDGDYPKDN